jgi:hypothetical protein
MNPIEAIISVKVTAGFREAEKLINEIRGIPGVDKVRLAFGRDADLIVFAMGQSQDDIALVSVKINSKEGVAGVFTTILANL